MIDALRLPGLLALASLFIVTSKVQAADDCDPKVGRIASFQGRVEVQRGTAGPWQPIGLNEALCQGDAVRAGPRSRASLALLNDAILRLDQNSTLHLQNIVGEAEERSLLDLLRGAIQSFSRKPRLIQVNTPYLNGTIEGTEFALRVGDDRTELTVLEGTVRASNAQGELVVAAGNSAVALAGKAPEPRTLVDPLDAVQWSLYYPPILAGSGTARSTAGSDIMEAANLLSVGQVAAAATAIDRALAADPNVGQAYALRSVIAVVQNRRDQALADAEKAVSLDDSTASMIALSYALQSSFRLEDAREVLRDATADDPTSALAWARLAELELMLSDRRAAMAAAARAVEIAPDLSRTQLVNGFAALSEYRYPDATTAFNQAIESDSADPLGHLGLGLARISVGQLAQGREELEIAVSLDSSNSLYRSYLGKAYFEEKRGPLDAEQFQVAKALDPLDPTPYLYDGIRKQTENDPVGALRDIEGSIERNDNRAVYRGRLALDQDRAARGTSLARIVSDLGFEQLGINAATDSLALDPGDASAHQFLADTYRSVRRREISRVSELFQAQMNQDINLNPIQPSISSTNLNIVTSGGPAAAGFNEFTPLFEQGRSQFNLSLLGGNKDTYAGEGVLSGTRDQLSYSLGAYGYDTNGWRDNNDLRHEIYSGFIQAAVSPSVNLQAEVGYRDSKEGDLVMRFDPDFFFPTLRRDIRRKFARVGARFSPSPDSDILLSYIHGKREEEGQVTQSLDFGFPGFPILFDLVTKIDTEEKSNQYEAQYTKRLRGLNFMLGGGISKVDQDLRQNQTLDGFDLGTFRDKPDIDDKRGYAYANVDVHEGVTLTGGFSYQDYEEDAFDFTRFNPKLGIRWNVNERIAFRAAWFKVVKPALATNRTLEPTQIAGFNQFFDDANATKSKRYGAALDFNATESVKVGAEFSWRKLSEPVFVADRAEFESRKERFHRAYGYWTVSDRVALSAEAVYDRYKSDEGINPDLPLKVRTISFPLRARYFHPSGWFGGVDFTYVDQHVDMSSASMQPGGDSGFGVVDLSVGYRLKRRQGIISIGIQNLLDRDFNYLDDSYREFRDEPSAGPYIPEITGVIRTTFSF